jgi:spore germination protein YaaH
MFSEVATDFVSLLRELRAELNSRQHGLSLTFDSTGYGTGYLFAQALAPGGADAVYIMAYPFHTRLSKNAGAVAPMGGLPFDVTDAVDRVLAQTTPDRVILGLPNFGMRWPTETRYRHALVRTDAALYGVPRNMPVSTAAELAAQHGRRWDPDQLVPWTRWRERACWSCPRTWWQLYYDDTQSTTIKYDFVNRRDLRGVGIWKLGYGSDRADFYSLLLDKFDQQ